MQIINADSVAEALPYDRLIESLKKAFSTETISPERTQHKIKTNGNYDATLLVMPAWRQGKNVGIKIVSVFPGNVEQNLSAVHANYFLLDAENGLPKAVLDGTELTLRRTACASALAADYLANHDVKTLLMVGTGNLAPHLVKAHMQVRDYSRVLIWGRRQKKAEQLISFLEFDNIKIDVVTDLKKAVSVADVISCATLSNEPLILGKWLKPGQHLDLVGAFTPEMREVDNQAVVLAKIVVDTYDGALSESGELITALKEGAIVEKDILAELAEVIKEEKTVRTKADEITLFKSVGTALEDLAAAELVLSNLE
ncbi:MAG: ornithine cyclodeaminase family protein [Pseudomonadota bacterium]|nr:ornithine cyclodeaminase family protein [Pseudomonadota bacterium]